MQISDLRTFVAVVEAGSLSRAAANLYLSQSTVSERITGLELELGVRLLDRTPRGIKVNDAGRDFYGRAHALIRDFDGLPESISSHEVTGTVAIGMPVTVSGSMVTELYAWMRNHYPGVRLQIFESFSGYIREMLTYERVDLAVLYRESKTQAAGEELLYSEDLHVLYKPGHWIEDSPLPISVTELANVPLVLTGEHSNLRRAADHGFRAVGLTPRVEGNIESLTGLLRITESGQACTVLPISAVNYFPDAGLRARRLVNPEIRRYATLVQAANYDPKNPAYAALRTGIRQVIHSLVETGSWQGITPLCSLA